MIPSRFLCVTEQLQHHDENNVYVPYQQHLQNPIWTAVTNTTLFLCINTLLCYRMMLLQLHLKFTTTIAIFVQSVVSNLCLYGTCPFDSTLFCITNHLVRNTDYGNQYVSNERYGSGIHNHQTTTRW